jgi:Cd2+/Zn2+-exporting ATPase
MAEIFRGDLPLIVPGAHEISDECVSALERILKNVEGVELVHSANAGERSPVDGDTPLPAGFQNDAQICVHFFPDIIELTQLLKLVQAAGAEIAKVYGHVSFSVDTFTRRSKAETLVQLLRAEPGIAAVSVSRDRTLIRIEFRKAEVSRFDVESMYRRIWLSIEAA